jgi:hypothetical protein
MKTSAATTALNLGPTLQHKSDGHCSKQNLYCAKDYIFPLFHETGCMKADATDSMSSKSG